MNASIRSAVAVPVALLFAAFVPIAAAQDRDRAAVEKEEQEEQVRYAVWTGGCSRSLRCQKTFDDPASACRFASGLGNKSGTVMVLAGRKSDADWSAALRVFRHLRNPAAPFECANCSVYSRQCRGGWAKLGADTDCVVTAESRAAKARDDGDTAQVIYQFGAPAQVQAAR